MATNRGKAHWFSWSKEGFTLVEVIIATAIMLIVVVVLLEVVTSMSTLWQKSTGTIENFEAARAAFTTINRTLSRAMLKTYIDYVDTSGNPISNTDVNSTTYLPAASFSRASELQFICGPTTQIATAATPAANYPGDAVLFQAPMGISTNLTAKGVKYLQNTLNSVGFFVEYSTLPNAVVPSWLNTALGLAASPPYRFRLIQYTQPTDSLNIYLTTALTTYNINWITGASNTGAVLSPIGVGATFQNTVLAENVVLLILRPRLEPQDEMALAGPLSATYNATTANSIISPNYHYDSRAWMTGYPLGGTRVENTVYAKYMRNQLPPIVDVALVAVDPNSLVRLGDTAAVPSELQVPAGTFTNSANLDADLATYSTQLTASHIRYRVFRSSVQMEGAAWVNN